MSGTARLWADINTTIARRNRTGSFAVLPIRANFRPSSIDNDRTNTSGRPTTTSRSTREDQPGPSAHRTDYRVNVPRRSTSVEVLDGTWSQMGFASRSEFGDVAWGGRSLADASKLNTPEQLTRMREVGLTQEAAQHWRNFYMNVHNQSAAKFPNNPEKVNPSARSRADLFQYYIDNI
jgi:hypothetical protein